jgi:hypothetical protein
MTKRKAGIAMSFLWKKHRRKNSVGLSRYSLLGITIIFSLGFMGIGFAAWNDSITLDTTLTTGYLKPVFTEATLSSDGEDWGEGIGQGSDEYFGAVEIFDGGKSLLVEFDEAERNGEYYLTFTIKNEGPLPVELNDFDIVPGKNLKVSMHHKPEKVVLDRQEETEGQLKIQVIDPQIEEACTDSFIVELNYHQAL